MVDYVAAGTKSEISDWVGPIVVPKNHGAAGYVNVSVAPEDAFEGEVTLERCFEDPQSSDALWRVVDTYSGQTEEYVLEPEVGVFYRIGVSQFTSGKVSEINLSDGGSYTAIPTIVIGGVTPHGGTGATAVARMVAKTVSSIGAAGTGYSAGDAVELAGGTKTTPASLLVATTKLISTAINAGGSGYAASDTVTLLGGTAGTKAVITVDTVDGGGAILTFHVSTAGSYTVNAASFTQHATSGVGIGATFNTNVFGVLTATVSVAGDNYSALPANPVGQSATSGAGSGATFNMAWEVNACPITDGGSGYTEGPDVAFSSGAAAATSEVQGGDVGLRIGARSRI